MLKIGDIEKRSLTTGEKNSYGSIRVDINDDEKNLVWYLGRPN